MSSQGVGTARPMTKREAGALGARKRWDADAAARGAPTGPRVLRLADCTPTQRRLILALLELDGSPPSGQS